METQMIEPSKLATTANTHPQPHQPINYDLLAIDILRLLRADRNQRDLSQALGFSFNQVGKWESLVTKIKWDDFLALANSLQIPIEKHFREYFFWSTEEKLTSNVSIQALLQYLNVGHENLNRPKATIDRWLAGHSVPDFSEVLMIMNSKPLILIGWLSKFLDCSKLPNLEIEFKQTLSKMEAVLSSPVSAIVNAALHLENYINLELHDEDLLAQEAGCSVKEVRLSLTLLCESGAVVFDQKKYISNFSELSFIRHPKFRAVTKYLTDLAASRFSLLPAQGNLANPSISTTRIAAMSSEASKTIMDLMVKFHHDVAQVLKNDKGAKDHVRLMIQHNFVSNIHAPSPDNRNKDS